MNRRHSIASAWMVATVLLTASVPAYAGQVSCETFNPCTEGVCLEDGTCEATPANNGSACDTFNACTVGTCSAGTCVESDANDGAACETSDPCMEKNGECSDGVCEAAVLTDGATCREDVMGPCVTGTCTTILEFSFCVPEFPCGQPDACDLHCNPNTGNCESYPTNVCNEPCRTGTCETVGEFEYTCSNVTNVPDETECFDPDLCNARCDAGECIGSGPSGGTCGDGNVGGDEECDDGDTEFSSGEACDGDCNLVPCGKPTNSSGVPPKASDALFILRTAVNLVTCELTVCDVNDSGTITSSDALLVLRKSVGANATLNCPTA